jgi:predicted short-subunit dehydrogenase-like oxidoreductase (DUF2520 family)
MPAKPSVAIVGPGRLGSALAAALIRGGYKIREIVCRNRAESLRSARSLAKAARAQLCTWEDGRLKADVIWFCVPDREVATTAKALAKGVRWKTKIVFHSSGALASDELDTLRRHGAAAASVHPLMTFVKESAPSLAGVPFALEGDSTAVRVARRISRDLGGVPFMIRKENKTAYHAWGAFISPLIVAELVTAEQVARAAGLRANEARKKMLPIVRQTIENYANFGPAGALSGPLVRGDTEIVRRHLAVLKKIPEAKNVYLALSRSALRYLPVGQRKKLQAILKS